MKTAKTQKALAELCIIYGMNKSKLARALDVDRSTVHHWFKCGYISATKAIIAERVTDGAITKEQLRPDVTDWWGL